jgi:hypothetical protein
VKQLFIDLHLDPEVVFNILKTYCKVLNKKVDDKTILLFEVYDLNHKKKLEEIFLKHIGSDWNLITNKLKPLKVTINYHSDRLWVLKIFQKNARANIFKKTIVVDDVKGELATILLPCHSKIEFEKKGLELENSYLSALRDLNNNIFLLKYDDLNILAGRENINSFEKKQILFTYTYYASQYDKNVEKIDDGEQYKIALELNKEVKPILEKLIDLMAENNIKKGN